MSLSTQLNRGKLALPLLLVFVVLGVIAGPSAKADAARVVTPVAVAKAVVAKVDLLADVCPCAVRPRALLLAQAPADLGNLVLRWSPACRG